MQTLSQKYITNDLFIHYIDKSTGTPPSLKEKKALTNCGNKDGNIINVLKNCISTSVATVLKCIKITVPICHWCLVINKKKEICENSCFHTEIAVHLSILGISWCDFLRESALQRPGWMKHTAFNECLALRDVHLALFWVRIKHQVMHRLSCLFKCNSIFIHSGSWKPLCEHTCPKKCGVIPA